MKSKLILMRHGESEWNHANRFAGRTDISLTEKGEAEAKGAGETLRRFLIVPDVVFSSPQKRAYRTAEISLREAGLTDLVPLIIRDDRLCERDYGDLTGLNKDEVREKYGKDQVKIWQRSYDTAPPGGESLRDVVENRIRPYYKEFLEPLLNEGKTVLVAAHNNSLRAMLIALGCYSPEEINDVVLPTGSPLVLEFENGVRTAKYYLADKLAA